MCALNAHDAIFMLDALKDGDDEEVAHGEAEQILMAFLRGNDFAKVADAFEAARDRVGFWYA